MEIPIQNEYIRIFYSTANIKFSIHQGYKFKVVKCFFIYSICNFKNLMFMPQFHFQTNLSPKVNKIRQLHMSKIKLL